MKTIAVAESMEESLAFVPGKNLQEKFSRLLENTLVLHLRECEDHLFKYESKYGMDASSFIDVYCNVENGRFDCSLICSGKRVFGYDKVLE